MGGQYTLLLGKPESELVYRPATNPLRSPKVCSSLLSFRVCSCAQPDRGLAAQVFRIGKDWDRAQMLQDNSL